MSISGSSIVLTFAVQTYSPAPVTIRGYGPDETVDAEALTVGEVMKGIDGFGTSGFMQTTLVTPFTLLADPQVVPSIDFMDGWMGAQMLLNGGTGDVLYAINGVITYPSLKRQMQVNNGTLRSFKPIPQGQKLLRPRQFSIEWINWSPMTQI